MSQTVCAINIILLDQIGNKLIQMPDETMLEIAQHLARASSPPVGYHQSAGTDKPGLWGEVFQMGF